MFKSINRIGLNILVSDIRCCILRHLATSLTLAEIANTLYISQNTIKTHCKHIYRKLGAKNRDDAVNKGKELFKI